MSRGCLLIALVLLPGCFLERGALGPNEEAVDAPGADAPQDDVLRPDAAVDAYSALDAYVNDVGIDAFVPDVGTDAPMPDAFDCSAITEACNARDDNCDGQVDEGACIVDGETCRPSVFGARVYLVCPLGRDWDEARALCTGLGSDYGFAVLRGSELASVNMIGDVRGKGFITWVGLSDDGGRIPGASEGRWWWTDNAAENDYSESTGNQDCGVIRGDDGAYGDRDCGSDHWFLCEAAIRPR